MRRTILLADDSPTIRRLINHTFADADFKIVEVNNGDAAIRTFEEIRPSVVLADIHMPGKNGYQVCAYVRSHSELGKTPVVLLVGAFEAFDQDTAKQAGATASITKPFEPGALIELVKSVMPHDAEEAEAAPPPEPEPQPQAYAPPPPEPKAHPQPPPEPKPHAQPQPKPILQTVAAAADNTQVIRVARAEPEVMPEGEDLLGLQSIFKEEPQTTVAGTLSDDDLDRIADRVIQRISTQVIENIAWDIVPDITEKIVREELKRNR